MSETAPSSSDTGTGGTWPERNYRTLKIAVIVMGFLLVAGFVLVFVTIVARMSGGSTAPADTPTTTALSGEAAALLGPDAEVVSSGIDGGRLALVVRRPEGLAVLVVDLRSGAVVNVIAP